MQQRVDSILVPPVMERQDSEDVSHGKKTKKKKKKHDKNGDHNKHKKSKHRKERKNDSSVSLEKSRLPGEDRLQSSIKNSNDNTCSQPSTTTMTQESSNSARSLDNQISSNQSSISNVSSSQLGVHLNNTPLSPGNFLQLRGMTDCKINLREKMNPPNDEIFHRPLLNRFQLNSTAMLPQRLPMPANIFSSGSMPPQPFMQNQVFRPVIPENFGRPPIPPPDQFCPPDGFRPAAMPRNFPLLPPERFLHPIDTSVPPPVNPALLPLPDRLHSLSSFRSPNADFQVRGNFHGNSFPPNHPVSAAFSNRQPNFSGFQSRPPMPEDFLPLHDFPPPKGMTSHEIRSEELKTNFYVNNYQQPQTSRFLSDITANIHTLEALKNCGIVIPSSSSVSDNPGQKVIGSSSSTPDRLPLATADYTKIVQALETLKSSNIIASTPPKGMKFENDLDLEAVSPLREEKEKKSRKHKKHKKEKKKDIKRRLEEKLAELATLNDNEGNSILRESIDENNKDLEKEQRNEWGWTKDVKRKEKTEHDGKRVLVRDVLKDKKKLCSDGSNDENDNGFKSANEIIPLLGEELEKSDTSESNQLQTASQPALSIQFNPKSSKFNLKIGSPIMKGNIFQKYKVRNDSPLFPSKHIEQGERKYRKSTRIDEDNDEIDSAKDPETKAELLKLLGIDQDKKTDGKHKSPDEEKDDKIIFSGSEEGEVISDEDELEERRKIKEIIKKAKEEALASASHSPSSRDGETKDNVDINKDENKELIISQEENITKVSEKDLHDGELSTDGEVSSDGEISEDSLDEFGRSKKLRGNLNINSPSDSSDEDSDDEKVRWGCSPKRSISPVDGEPSRSPSPSPDRSVSLTDKADMHNECDEVNHEITDSIEPDPPGVAPMTDESDSFKNTSQGLEEENKETVEKERLRLEVEKLESAIDEDVISKSKNNPNAGSESSATDISDEEIGDNDLDDNLNIAIMPSNSCKDQIKATIDNEIEKENLKREILEIINQKEKGCHIDKTVSASNNEQPDKNKEELQENQDEGKGDDYIDIFAESDTELRKEKSDNETDNYSGNQNLTSIDNEINAEYLVDNNLSVKSSNVDIGHFDSNNYVAPFADPLSVKVNDDESRKEESDDFEKRLKSLSDIRNSMSLMTKEELEEALKKLPSLTESEDLAIDGRNTPVHLRDIQIPLVSLTEYVEDKNFLYKQVFRNINKKEFKFMLPKYLRKFNVKTVRNWCLDEMDIMSRKRLRAIILRQFLASSSSESDEDDQVEESDAVNVVKEESLDTYDDNDQKQKSKRNKKKKEKEKCKKLKKKKVNVKEEQTENESNNTDLLTNASFDSQNAPVTNQNDVQNNVIDANAEENYEKNPDGENDKDEQKSEKTASEDSAIMESWKNSDFDKAKTKLDCPAASIEMKPDITNCSFGVDIPDETLKTLGDKEAIINNSQAESEGENSKANFSSPRNNNELQTGDDETLKLECKDKMDSETLNQMKMEYESFTNSLTNLQSKKNNDVKEKVLTADEKFVSETNDNPNGIKERNCNVTTKATSSESESGGSRSDSDDEVSEDSNGNISDSGANKSDSEVNKSDSAANKSGSDSESESGSESSDSDSKNNKSSSDSDALENISSDEVVKALKSSEDEDEDDNESSVDSDDESSDMESKANKVKIKSKDLFKQEKTEPRSSSNTDNSSSEESSRQIKDSTSNSKDKLKDQEIWRHKRSDAQRRDRKSFDGKLLSGREMYRLGKEKQMIKQSLQRKNKKESEQENSDDDYEEEVDERRQRIARYYREKERHKHQRERNTVDQQEVVHRKVIKPKMEPNTSNEEDENESSEESFQEENIRFKNDMDVSMTIQRNEQEHEEFMKYLAMKRRREQEKMDLRRKLVGNKNDMESIVVRNKFNRRQVSVTDSRLSQQGCLMRSPNQHISQSTQHVLQSNQLMQKPEGYDERRRQRELEKQKILDSTRRDVRRSADHRSPTIKDSYSEKSNCDYNNRGREPTRSSEEYRNDKKYSRESSDPYSRDSSINRRNRDSSKTGDTSKRKVVRTRSSSEESLKHGNRRRKKQRNRSIESIADAKPASHLRELEFRARALQSLLNKKEESNKAIRRGER